MNETLTHTPFRLSYLPALDGLRGIAILLVMGFHSMLPFMRGGFIGVNIFFVLSGFLITSVLIKEWDATRRINIRHFYLRRILRLAPALLLMLIVVNLYALLFRFSAEIETLQHDTVVTLFYLSNWGLVFGFLEGAYLAPTWSLAIEEQFYLFFPWLLTLLLQRLSRWGVIAALFGLSLLSLMWRLVLLIQGVPPKRVYYALDTRLDELLMGAALAVICATAAYGPLKQWIMRYRTAAGSIAVAACCLIAWITYSADLDVRLTYALALPPGALAAWVLILYLVTIDTSPLKRLLEWRPLVYIGKISYGLYLWHWIWQLILYPTLGLSYISPTMRVIGTTLSLITASLSYHLLERPVMGLKKRFEGSGQAQPIDLQEANADR